MKHQIKNEAGLPIEFKRHKFLYDIYNDLSPLQVILKPPQVGMTVEEIVKTFWVAKKIGKDIIYTLPTDGDVGDMAGGKVNRIVAQNPILKEWVKDHDTVEQKAVGASLIYYRGTFTKKKAMMVSSDLNVHDEVDASDQSVITQYETRLQAKDKKDAWRWYFSHPSLAGYGVDVYWQQSDKKEWFIKCQICQTEQVMAEQGQWKKNINFERKTYCCAFCGGDLTDETRINGEWRPTSEGEFSGYHISQFMCPWISAETIIAAYHDPLKDEQYFHNYVLGLPYVASENKISPEVVLKNVTRDVNQQEGRIVIGVDTGLPIYFTIASKDGVFFHGKCKNTDNGHDPYDELEAFLKRWDKAILVADQGGDLIGIRKLQDKYPGRVFLCYYRRDRKSKEVIKWGKDKEFGIVTVDRNRMMQLIIEQLRDPGRIKLNGTVEEWTEWAKQFGNIYRTMKPPEEAHYGPEFVWQRNGPDHFVHSLVYALVGLDRYSESEAKIVGTDPIAHINVGRIFTDPFSDQ